MSGESVLSRLTAALAGRYRIERELGAGGMATVCLAEDVRHRRKVAVKVLHPELTALLGPDRFLKEIELTAALQHPHILPLFDSGAADGLLYYVMPYVEGETLRSRLTREHQLPVPEALRIAGDVADALEYAHKRGVIHRDIKPENILLHEGRPQVADFGIALAVQHAGGSRMTQTGMSLGTPQYMAPEQAMGDKSVDARADVYALGAVTYEMLTGEPPFTGPTAQAIVAKVMTEAPQPLTELRKTVPHHVNDAVLTALEKLPADRFASTSEFARALHDPAFKTAHRDTVRGPGSAAILRNRSAMVLMAGIALAAAAAGAAITWSLRRPVVQSAVVARFELPLPDSAFIPIFGGDSPLFPTRDGRLLWATTNGLYERSLDGLTRRRVRDLDGASNPAAPPELLQRGSHAALEAVQTPRGDTILYRENADSTGRDIYLLPLGGKAEPFAAGLFEERSPTLSQDGRLVLYVSNESGQDEVYLRPLAGAGRVQVSGNGGAEPRWGPGAREAYYWSQDTLFAVPITRAPAPAAGARCVVLAGRYAREAYHANYDIAPDGKTFVFVRSTGGESASAVTVLLNWITAPRGRAPDDRLGATRLGS